MPGQQHVGVHTEGRARSPEGQGRVLAVVVDDHAVAAVQSSFGNSIEQAECGHHGASGQHLDLQFAAGHVVDLLGKIKGVLVKDIFRRPGRLETERGGSLRLGDHGEGQRACTGSTSAGKEFTTVGGCFFCSGYFFGVCHRCLLNG